MELISSVVEGTTKPMKCALAIHIISPITLINLFGFLLAMYLIFSGFHCAANIITKRTFFILKRIKIQAYGGFPGGLDTVRILIHCIHLLGHRKTY
jgi:hypothetical protein